MLLPLTEQSPVAKPTADERAQLAVYDYLFSLLKGDEVQEGTNAAETVEGEQPPLPIVLESPSRHDLNTWFSLRASEKEGLHLRTQGYVGVFGFKLSDGNNVTVEILPKTYRADPQGYRKEDMGLLCKMIVATHLTDSLAQLPDVDLGEVDDTSLLDVFIKLFVNRVEEVLKRGMNRGYVEQEDNLRYIRGRLDVTQNLRTNYINRARFYCQFDEFSEDIAENRLIFSALNVVQRVANDVNLRKKINACLFQFDEVTPCINLHADLAAVEVKPLAPDYREAVRWSDFILKMIGLDIVGGNAQRTPSFMFDMANLFERYIAEVLRRKSRNMHVVHDAQSKYLASPVVQELFKGAGSETFEQKPDYQLFDTRADAQQVSFIADAKWKMIDNESSTLNLSSADVRQIYTYVNLFKPVSNMGALIFPATSDGQFQYSCEFCFKQPEDNDVACYMWVLAYDLGKDKFLFKPGTEDQHKSLTDLNELIDLDIPDFNQ